MPHVHEMGRVVISDRDHKNMQDSYELAPKKRLWKYTLTDKWGTNTRVRRDGDRFVNWSLLDRKWNVIISYSMLMTNDSIVVEPTSEVGEAIFEAGVDVNEALTTAVAENHTGKHTRNHPVRVPKGADGCVRL